MTSQVIDDIDKVQEFLKDKKYISKPIMTKYEFNSIIALRTTHLSLGAIPFVDIPNDLKITTNMELRKIAIRELKEGKLPFIVKRTIPNHLPEYWNIKDMDLQAVRNIIRD